jgi:hypothetical protein
MPRIVTPNVEAVPEAARPALTATQKKIGRIPNLFRVVANGPAALNGHLGLSNAPRSPRGAAARSMRLHYDHTFREIRNS